MGLLDIFDRAVANHQEQRLQIWMKPIWNSEQVRKLIAKYPNGKDLWLKAVAYLDQQADAGASDEWYQACFAVLEKEWEQQREKTITMTE